MRMSFPSLVLLCGLASAGGAPAALAAARTGVEPPHGPITEVYYYYHGHRYPYYWNHRYYNHRRWRRGRWYYY